MQHPSYFTGLDAVRSLSFFVVVLAHMRLLGIGWVAIQCFFVLSGFLITGILLRLRERTSVTQYLKIFYVRRTLRIFPIYYLALTILVLMVATELVQAHGDISQTKFAYLYVWNWYAIFHDGPLNHDLEHFWSLAVEEQFYLIWPLVVFSFSGNRFFYAALFLIIAGPLIRFVSVELWITYATSPVDPYKALYQMSTTYLDAFATGALLCYAYKQPWTQHFKAWHFIVAMIVILAAGWLASDTFVARGGPYNTPFNLGFPIHMGDNYQYLWGYTAVNLLSAGLLLLVLQGRFFNATFQNRSLGRMGVITYSAYIFHLPLLHYAHPLIHQLATLTGSLTTAKFIAAPFFILFVYLLSEISYRHFESWFLRLKDRLNT